MTNFLELATNVSYITIDGSHRDTLKKSENVKQVSNLVEIQHLFFFSLLKEM